MIIRIDIIGYAVGAALLFTDVAFLGGLIIAMSFLYRFELQIQKDEE